MQILQNFLSSNEQKVTSNENKVTSNEQKVMSTAQKVTTNEQKLTSNEQKLMNNKQYLTSKEQKLTSNEQKVSPRTCVCITPPHRPKTSRFSSKRFSIFISQKSLDKKIFSLIPLFISPK